MKKVHVKFIALLAYGQGDELGSQWVSLPSPWLLGLRELLQKGGRGKHRFLTHFGHSFKHI